MKNSRQRSRLPKFLQRFTDPRILGLLAAFQLLILLILIRTLPPVTLTLPPVTLTLPPVTLILVVPSPEAEDDYWPSLIKDFQVKNPDIRIDLVKGPYTTDEVQPIYTSALETGNSFYDLIYMDIIWVPKFAAAGWLQDLSDQISQKELAQFLPDDVDGGRYEKKLYRIPFRSDVGMLYYRKDLLEQAGYQPPETFTELIETAQALQKQGAADWGYVWQGRQYEGLVAMFVEVLESYGGFWIDPKTGELGLEQPAAIKAVEFLRRTIEQGISPPDVTTYTEEESFTKFQQGETVFLRNWPYIWARADAANSLHGKVGIKPIVHAPNRSSRGCKGGWGFGIAKNAKHPKEAWRAIQFFTSEAAQRKFVLETSYLPSRRTLFNDPQIVDKYSHFPEILKEVENSVLRPPIYKYKEASDILQRYLSAALTGPSPKDAMKAAAEETRDRLGEKLTASDFR